MPHVVWDWNGTLFDDLPVVVASVNAALESIGAGPIDEDGYRRHYRRPVHLAYESILRRPVGPEEFAGLDRVFHDTYRDLSAGVGLAADARHAVETVTRTGASQSVLSMWWHDDLGPAVRRFGLDEHMVAVEGNRGEPGARKEGRLAEHVTRLTVLVPGLDPAEIVMVGDITDDAEAAAACGIDCVLYDGGSQPVSVLRAAGVPVAATLMEAVALAGLGAG